MKSTLTLSLRRTVFATGALLALAAGSAWAEPQSLQKEGTGLVTITSGNSATIVNDALEYGAVYTKSNLMKFEKNKIKPRPIGQVSFSFESSGDVAGGAPRFSIGIDTDGNGTVDGFAFLDVNGCGSTTVSTESETCQVFFNAQTFPNWDAFVEANPTYTSAFVPFIISDQPGTYVITHIDVK